MHRPLSLSAMAAITLCLLSRPSAAEDDARVAILVYHRFGAAVTDAMTVTTPVFESQLAWLRTNDYAVVPLRRVVDGLRGRAAPVGGRAVAITADDGHRTVYSVMFPLIERYRIPVTLFIYPSAISNAPYALTWEQLAAMQRSGLVDVQSHTYWHPNFKQERRKNDAAAFGSLVEMQFSRSRRTIADRLGGNVDMLAWPFGIHDEELERAAAAAGFIAAFTIDRRPAGPGAMLLALPRYLMTDQDRGPRFAAIVQASKPETKQ